MGNKTVSLYHPTSCTNNTTKIAPLNLPVWYHPVLSFNLAIFVLSSLLIQPSWAAKSSDPKLNPTVTQVLLTTKQTQVPSADPSQNNATINATDDIGSGDEPSDETASAQSATPVPAQNIPTGNNPATATVSAQASSPLPPSEPTIGQVPLGAISPDTIAKFVKMIDIVRQEYVRPVDDEMLFANAMTGTLTALDPYSEYLDNDAYNNLKLFTDGDVGSIGVKVSLHPDSKTWVFDEVLPNSPAATAGIQRGNYLHQINDYKLSDEQTQQDIDQLLTGIAGTQLKLVVSDSGRRKHTVNLQRTLVEQQAIQAQVIQEIAVVHIPIFQNNTQQQFLSALASLNQPFTGILLDIRNNPGGVLTSATDIVSLFMANKTVVQVKNRQGLQEVIKTQPTAQLLNVPLAVLQNRYSASAAEVLASSLQQNGRAKIYGETSYGKGSIQSIVPINDNEAVKLTVAHYYSANGQKIDGIGVKPDVPLQDSELTWQDNVIKAMQTMARPTKYQLQADQSIQAF